MRKLIVVLSLLTLAWPVLAQAPDAVVRQLYQTHRKLNQLEKTVAHSGSLFTPGFLKLFQKAIMSPPEGGDFLDYDFLINSQDSWSDFQVGQTHWDGKYAIVPVTLWLGEPGHGRNPNIKSTLAKVFLTDLGHGYQIYDIKHVGNGVDGRSVRDDLTTIVNASQQRKK